MRVGGAPGALAITREGVLVLDTRSGAVSVIDARTQALRHLATVEGFPTSIAVGAGSAWVVDARSGTITKLRSR